MILHDSILLSHHVLNQKVCIFLLRSAPTFRYYFPVFNSRRGICLLSFIYLLCAADFFLSAL